MDFGFIQVAAPASQPVPPTDASIPAGVSKDAAAAFDAALAATLRSADGQATPVAGGGAKVAQPAWLLTQFFAPTATAFDVATTPVTIAGESAAADELPVPADVTADDESSDELDAIAAGLVVPMPVIAEIKTAIVPQGGPVVADGGVSGEQATPAPMTQSRVPAALDGTAQVRVPAVALPGSKSAALADVSGDTAKTSAHTAKTSVHTAETSVHTATVPMVAAPVDAPAGDVAAGNASVGPVSAPVEQPVSAQAPTGIAADPGDMPGQAKAGMPHADAAHRATQAPEAAQHAIAAAPALANAVAAVADQAAPAMNAASPAPRTESAESGAAVRQAMSWQAQSGHDAPMTGQDNHGQGQGRPSPEFTRFAAALAQVTSAGAEEGGRAVGPVVAPVASGAAPAAAQPHVTAATATAAPQSAPETPEAESLGRLVQTMRVISRPGAWEANVRLKPEHLGDVNIAVRVERNTVSAVVNAEAAGVRQWLESQEQAVRSGMAEHGLHLERFVVQRDGQRREPQHQEQPESRRQSSRRPTAATQRFEIVV